MKQRSRKFRARLPRIPRVAFGMLLIVLFFGPVALIAGIGADPPPKAVVRLLGGLALLLSGASFAIAERLGVLKDHDDLVSLFPDSPVGPDPTPAPWVVAEEAANALQEVPGIAKDAALEQVEEVLLSPTDLLS